MANKSELKTSAKIYDEKQMQKKMQNSNKN